MKNVILALSLAYAAGSVGGLMNSVAVWLLGLSGITTGLEYQYCYPIKCGVAISSSRLGRIVGIPLPDSAVRQFTICKRSDLQYWADFSPVVYCFSFQARQRINGIGSGFAHAFAGYLCKFGLGYRNFILAGLD